MRSRTKRRGYGLESLETRRLLSVSYVHEHTVYADSPSEMGQFGEVIETRGNLVLVGNPNLQVDFDPEQVGEEFGVGRAYLIDATSGQIVRVFEDPDPRTAGQFGSAVTFVGDRIAIAARGKSTVFIYDDAQDTTPTIIYDELADQSMGYLGNALAAYGEDKLFVSTETDYNPDPSGRIGNGSVRVFDAVTGAELQTIRNPIEGSYSQDMFGRNIATDGDRLLVAAQRYSEDGQFGFEEIVIQYNLVTDSLEQIYTMVGGLSDVERFGVLGLEIEGDNVLISAPYEDDMFPTVTGGVVYHFDAATGQEITRYYNPANEFPEYLYFTQFGADIDVQDGKLVVGSTYNYYYEFENMPGAVHVYDLATQELLATIRAPQTWDNQYGVVEFGYQTRFLGDGGLAIGSYWDSAAGPMFSGSVQIYSVDAGETPNNAPTASASVDNSSPVAGETIYLDGTASSDPDAGDVLTYEWDFDYDGVNFDVDAAGANTSTSYATSGSRTIALRVTDAGGLSSIATILIDVQAPVNVAPTASISGPATGVRTVALSFSGSFVDPTIGDSHEVAWNFGDGNVIGFHPATDAGALNVSHAFASAGTYNVTFSVRDSAGNVSTASQQVVVSSVGIVDGNLWVLGNSSSANVVLVSAAGGGAVNVNYNGGNAGNFSPTGQIIVIGGSGVDLVVIDPAVNIDAIIDGGAGIDLLAGGGGNDIILGGAGADLIVGGGGRDLLIGGADLDVIVGDGGDDILIGGTTSHGSNYAVLKSILGVWTSSDSYTARRNALLANGLKPDVNVFDDNAIDILTGSAGQDWFFGENEGSILQRDIVVDRISTEVFNDVDVVSLL